MYLLDFLNTVFSNYLEQKLGLESNVALYPGFTPGPKIAKFLFDETLEEILINKDKKEGWTRERVQEKNQFANVSKCNQSCRSYSSMPWTLKIFVGQKPKTGRNMEILPKQILIIYCRL